MTDKWHECPECGRFFPPERDKQIFCSRACARFREARERDPNSKIDQLMTIIRTDIEKFFKKGS